MTVLVTGATGNVGRRVVEHLVQAGQPVRAMTRNPLLAGLPGEVDVRYGDFERPATWPDVLHGVDRVYLFPHTDVVSESGQRFADLAVKSGVDRFVVHSAAAAGFPPGQECGDEGLRHLRRHLAEERRAHRDVELRVERTGAEWTHVRPGLLAVNALAWADSIRTGRVVREPYPTAGYPWVHEDDIAEVAVMALLTDEHVGAAWTLTGPAKVTRADQVAAIADAIGKPVRFEELTPEQARPHWIREGWPEEFVEWMLELWVDSVAGTGCLPPTDAVERITGHVPRDFARWARDHRADFLS